MRAWFKVRTGGALLALLFVFFFATSLSGAPRRIVSLSPVGTEFLFALGLGDRLVGVTDFCDTPPEARTKPRLGGFAALNLEALLAAETDLIVFQDLHLQFLPQIERLGIPYVLLKQNSVEEVLLSVEALGRACGEEAAAAALIGTMRAEIAALAEKVAATASRPRVLLAVSRELSEPRITSFYAAGRATFYNELIELAGGANAVGPGGADYPLLSVEGLLSLNPEVIVDLIGDRNFYHSMEPVDAEYVFDRERLARQWTESAKVSAVTEGRVHILEGTLFLRPGPRIGRILRAFAEILHPEIEWIP